MSSYLLIIICELVLLTVQPKLKILASTNNLRLNTTEMHTESENKIFNDKLTINLNSPKPCGGYLTHSHGIIQTPNFPNKFETPITCIWIIDGSNFAIGSNISIIIYFTQLYVLNGLRFTEYMYYSDDYKVPSQRIFDINEDNVTKVTWIKFNSQYLEIKFTMQMIEGTHLRALDHFLDVYGFNITYEVDLVKSFQCNTLKCRFLGHCYATHDFRSYYCSCFPGYDGIDCGDGPICNDKEILYCKNGGKCRHLGNSATTCSCLNGFEGQQCEISVVKENVDCSSNVTTCKQYCVFNKFNNSCSCSLKLADIETDQQSKNRFEITIRLGQNYQFLDGKGTHKNGNFSAILIKYMNRVLRNFNVSKINGLGLIKNLNNDYTFQFFGMELDSNSIREAITRMVERGRIGNITIDQNFLYFEEHPLLQIQSVKSNHNTPIREGTEFILSCTAKGSSRMIFHWYKDGAIVNISTASREMWTTAIPPEQKDTYTALLGIRTAHKMDEGAYTCHVTDWGIEDCGTTFVKILSPPKLQLMPYSATLNRGDSIRLCCLPSKHAYGKLGYSWTRNGILFQSDPNSVMWEDLFPDGSILKINNIQKSSDYSCVVSNSIAPVSKSVQLNVITQNISQLCSNEILFDIEWLPTLSGTYFLSKCPKGYTGQAKRFCEQRDINTSTWLNPDFSNCIPNNLSDISNAELTLGYQKINCAIVLQTCLEYVMRRYKHFFPGEPSFLVELLEKVDRYLKIKGSNLENEIAAEVILNILDKVIQNGVGLNSQQQLDRVQELAQSRALYRETIAASQLATSTSSSSMSAISSPSLGSSSSSSSSALKPLSSSEGGTIAASFTLTSAIAAASLSLDRLNSLRTYTTPIKALPFSLKIVGNDLFMDQLFLEIKSSPKLIEIMKTQTIFASVISYKNLTKFLPHTYSAQDSEGSDVKFIPASRIIATSLFQSNRSNDNFVDPLHLPLNVGHAELVFQHDFIQTNSNWIPICGQSSRATFATIWNIEVCNTKTIKENLTRCICPLSGTFMILLTKRNLNVFGLKNTTRPIFILIGCSCCFIQSCIAFILLVPILYNRKCCLTFLKMQFCTSTATVMAILLLGFLNMLPTDWHGIISSTLASLKLLGLSTLVGILLIIYADLLPKRVQSSNLSSGIRGALGISWFLPILFAICSQLIYNITKNWPKYWWLEAYSFTFILFIIVEGLLISLFILLSTTLVRKLLKLIRKHDKHNALLWRRFHIFYRVAAVSFIKVITDVLYLIYFNISNNLITRYAFGVFCITLGFFILICFVIKAEYNNHSGPVSKQNTNLSHEDNIFTGNVEDSFNFYKSQSIEKNLDCGNISSSIKKIPLTIYQTPTSSSTTLPQKSVDTFIASKVSKSEVNTILVDNINQNFSKDIIPPNEPSYSYKLKSRCCNILGAGSTSSDEPWEHEINDVRGFYDIYQDGQVKCIPIENHEFVGVETLDILQGVSPDSIIGIRTGSTPKQAGIITSFSNSNQNYKKAKIPKRVTIQEPNESLHIPKVCTESIPTNKPSNNQQPQPPIITITPSTESVQNHPPERISILTSTSDKYDDNTGTNFVDGMLDRISHDLNYLLNHDENLTSPEYSYSNNVNNKNEMKVIGNLSEYTENDKCEINLTDINSSNSETKLFSPCLKMQAKTSCNLINHNRQIHDVIIEESEQELDQSASN